MPVALVFLLSLSVGFAAYGQSSGPPSGLPVGRCAIEGTVVNAVTSEPVTKALVRLHAPNGTDQSAFTGAAGDFAFMELQPGQYTLEAHAIGYVSRSDELPWIEVRLAAGQSRRDAVLRLLPEGVISGRVYDEDGDPLEEAVVWALRSIYSDHHRRLVPVGAGGSAQTNERGEYRIYNLSPGPYAVVAIYRSRSDPRRAFLPTFYAGTSDPDQASPVDVRPGDEVHEVNFTFLVSPAVCVRGRATLQSTSKTVLPASIELVPRAGWRLAWAVTVGHYSTSGQNDQGEFQICSVPPGSYSAFANANDRSQEKFFFGRSSVEIGNTDVEGVNILVDPMFDIRGRVRTDPAAQLDLSRLGIHLSSLDKEESGAYAPVSADGNFVIHNVFDDSYRLQVNGFPEEFYLKSARLGGADVLDSGLTVNYGPSPGILDVVLSSDGGRIDGSVASDEKPVAGALVVLVPDAVHRNHDELYRWTKSDPLGRFTMLGLPPGDSTLYAFDRMEDESYKDPHFLKLLAGRGTLVQIERKQQQSVQLNLIQKVDELY